VPNLYTWTYKVTGSGTFPDDMLRYDRCWIDAADDLLALREELQDTEPAPHFLPRRTVTVIGQKEPTVGRWQSFGWTVSDVTKRQGMAPDPTFGSR
jgi:hypothetical protein